MRILSAIPLLAAMLALLAPALASEPFPPSGSAKLAAYTVCHSAVIVDMGPVGSNSSAECVGIVKTRDGSKLLDNLSIRCQEDAKARPEGYAFTGTCIHTDGDGDKLFMTYEGAGERHDRDPWRDRQIYGRRRGRNVERHRCSRQYGATFPVHARL